MIGGRSGRCAPGPSTMRPAAVPPGRASLGQVQQLVRPLYAVGAAASRATDAASCTSSWSAGGHQQQRKRPGCACDCIAPCGPIDAGADEAAAAADRSPQPLDLSLPKVKVRQHWSGGSIVQVNESTIISIRSGGCSPAATSGRLDVSVVTTTPRDASAPAPSLLRAPQVRLRIEIPVESKAASAVSMSDDSDDDLRRLAESANQLRQCGFYYAHLSWKDSVHLLQNTQVGTFLVRDSSDARYLYALSIQTDKGPTSVRVHYSSRGFRLDASQSQLADHLPRFRTVLHLVDHYVAKGSQCRDKGQFWLDNSGHVHSEVQLSRPLRRDVATLQHQCRLAWNERQREVTKGLRSPLDQVPASIRSYLAEYPFVH